DPHRSRRGELLTEGGQIPAIAGALPLKRTSPLWIFIVNDARVPGLHQAAGNICSPSSQADPSQLHPSPPFSAHRSAGTEPPAAPGLALPLCLQIAASIARLPSARKGRFIARKIADNSLTCSQRLNTCGCAAASLPLTRRWTVCSLTSA